MSASFVFTMKAGVVTGVPLLNDTLPITLRVIGLLIVTFAERVGEPWKAIEE